MVFNSWGNLNERDQIWCSTGLPEQQVDATSESGFNDMAAVHGLVHYDLSRVRVGRSYHSARS
jgi:hypothetical protein